MDKKLRATLLDSSSSSPHEFLKTLKTLTLKSLKSSTSLKSLIHSLPPNSPLTNTLPFSLHESLSLAIARFHNPENPKSPTSPPNKRLRRSNRLGTSEKHDPPNVDEEKENALGNVRVYAYLLLVCVSHPKRVFDNQGLLMGVKVLHDNLRYLECDSALMNDVSVLCEEWWKEERAGREELISQCLPYLVARSLTLKKKVDLHRVYAMREGFGLFDFEDSSIDDLKHLLLRCVIEPLYLKTEEGRRFIVFMFGLCSQLMREVLAMIKAQIPFGKKSILDAYGEMLFRAWKSVDEESRKEMENGFLQEMIEGALYARTKELAASVRRVLGGFVTQRTTEGVEKLIFRLTEPLIFRSLQAANSNVRQNALHLLLDLFPLEDPDSTKEVKDTLLEKQFFLLDKLIMDVCPDIRVVAVEGSCRILRLFWEVIPPSSITKVITKIFYDMSHDICSEVRLSTVNGVIYLLGNPQSHEVLKVLLPRLGHLMLDSVLSVRVALAHLLLLLSDIRGFHYNKVVRLEVLLSTLANDQTPVAQKITKLLMPSYFPSTVKPDEACTRCITLIKRFPSAGARFCEFAISVGASTKTILKLIRALINMVISANNLEQDQIEGLLIAAASLCSNLANDSLDKTALKDLLSAKKVKCLYAAASTDRARSSIFTILSTVVQEYASGLLEECIALITSCGDLAESLERQTMVKSVHRLLLSCNASDNMFEALTRFLQKVSPCSHAKFDTEIPKQTVSSPKRKKSKNSIKLSAKGKTVAGKNPRNFEEDYQTSVGISWQMKDLLMSEETRKVILGSQFLEQMFLALKVISEISIVQCVNCDYMDAVPVEAYASVALHVSSNNISVISTGTSNTKKSNQGNASEIWTETALDVALNHLLECADKLFRAHDSGRCPAMTSKSKVSNGKMAHSHGKKQGKPEADNASPSDNGQMKLSKRVRMLTAMLKFIVDAITLGVGSHFHQRCLMFTSAYIQHVISSKRYSSANFHLEEDVLKEIFYCLKSSFTYSAKLLNLVLTASSEASPLQLDVFTLANNLLDFITWVESSLGSRYAGWLVGTAKPWLPDLILALGSAQALNQNRGELTVSPVTDHMKHHFPSWLTRLARSEFLKTISSVEDDDNESESAKSPIFDKFIQEMVSLLKGKPKVLDAVGSTLLTGVEVGVEGKNFELVVGLLHFVCVKLVGCERNDWDDLDMMLQFLRFICPQINRVFEDQLQEDERESTRDFLRSVECLLAETGEDKE